MTGASHSIDVSEHGLASVAAIHGEIDSSNAPAVRASLLDLQAPRLVVDLRDVRYLDSAGIAMLEAVRRQAELALVVAVPSVISRSLDITGMLQLIPAYPSVEEALRVHGC